VAIEEGEQGIGLLFESIDQVIDYSGGWHGGGRPPRVGIKLTLQEITRPALSLCQPGMR
jgi:hypothetical protein